MLIIGKLTTII